MTTQTDNLIIGDKVTFMPLGLPDGTPINGSVVDAYITSVDGVALQADDMPCYVVLTDDDSTWAVPVSWIIQRQ